MGLYPRHFQEPGVSYFLFGPRGTGKRKIGQVLCWPIEDFLKTLIVFTVKNKNSDSLFFEFGEKYWYVQVVSDSLIASMAFGDSAATAFGWGD